MSKEQSQDLIRLNTLIQELGGASRRKADELIKAGSVKVNGKIVKTLGIKVEKNSSISIDGKVLNKAPKKVTILFNKPFMTVSSRKDEKSRPTIYDLPDIKKLASNVQSVGRLDYRSEGLLILTNDGDLAYALSHPKYSVEKTYAVLLSTQVNIEDAEKLRKGLELEDGLAKAISVKIGSKEQLGNSMGQWLELVVTEGRNRLVRRMMEALGLSVVRLVRVGIGELRLPAKLEPGKARFVTDTEAKYLAEIKTSMLAETHSKGIGKPKLSKEVLEARKLKRKIKLNDADYAREAERREMRAKQLSKARKSVYKERDDNSNRLEKPRTHSKKR